MEWVGLGMRRGIRVIYVYFRAYLPFCSRCSISYHVLNFYIIAHVF